jgi:hypothetical protein
MLDGSLFSFMSGCERTATGEMPREFLMISGGVFQ